MKNAAISLVVVTLSARAWPAPLSGVDCECSQVGSYVLPVLPTEPPAAHGITGASPLNKYVLSAAPVGDGSFMVSIADASAPGTPIFSQPGASWGFSPDDDRFVLVHFEGGLPYGALYNLEGANPHLPIYETRNLDAGGYISFSPNGHYALSMWLGPSTDTFGLEVLDAETGAVVYDDGFLFAAPPADALPAEETQLDAVVVGFGPDDFDRSLVYTYVQPNGLIQRTLVNLERTPTTAWGGPSTYGFKWGFSPCGDVLSVVTANTHTQLKEARLYATRDFAQLGLAEYPLTDTDTLRATAASHIATHNVTQTTLASNRADESCGAVTTLPPTASFSAPSNALTLLAVAFADQSTTAAPSTITSRHWSFGDGTSASGENPTHVYFAPGTYSVQLTVTNSDGRADSVSHDIVVGTNQPPTASFAFSPSTPATRSVVTFTSTSTDDDSTPTAFWSIDGESFEGQEVSVKVCAPSVSVSLTTRDSAGQETTVMEDIPLASDPELEVPVGGDLVAAAQSACPGDTLVLEAGHYAGGVKLDGVNLRGQGRGVSFIDGYGDEALSEGWVLTLESPWSLSGRPTVSVSDVSMTGGGVSSTEGGGVRIRFAPVVLSDVEVTDNAGLAGIWSYNNGSSSPIEIRDTHVHQNESTGIWLDTCELVAITESDVSFNQNGGVSVTESANVELWLNDVHDNTSSSNWAGMDLDIRDSWVFGNRLYGNSSSQSDGVAVYLSGAAHLSGNLVVANQAGGIFDRVGNPIVGTTVANNCGAGLSSNGSGTKLHNSIVYANTTDVAGDLAEDSANLIGVDPLFVAPNDYHLGAGSPAIDQGDDTYAASSDTATDGDGDPRILGSSVDIGWDEWRAGQTSVPLTATGCSPPNTGGTGGTGSGGDNSVGGTGGDNSAGGNNTGGRSAGGTSAGGNLGVGGQGGDTSTGGNTEVPGTGGDTGSAAAPGVAGAPTTNDEPGSKSDSDAGCSCNLVNTGSAPAGPFALLSAVGLLLARRGQRRGRSAV